MKKSVIGVFDSGLGGLTAVREMLRSMPGTDIVYFGDTGRVPYGTRSKETIIRYTRQNIRFLKKFDIDALLIACGTASSAALPVVCDDESFPIIGVVESASLKAAEITRNSKIGIIGTNATISSRAYSDMLKKINPDISTISQACPLFVPLVENGRISPDDEVLRLTVAEYLAPLRDAGVDTLIMGCTHYPIIARAIGDFLGDDVCLVNPGAEAARYLSSLPEFSSQPGSGGQIRFFVSDDADAFSHNASVFLGAEIGERVELINIEDF